MKFDREDLELEFLANLHPEVRQVVEELDLWCVEEGLPGVVVTCVSRAPEANAKVSGAPKSLHLFDCAVDLRNRHLRAPQRASVFAWLLRRCPREKWELLDHDVGHGQHFHLGRRDAQWRKTYPASVQ